jgi:hypothetical protein
MRGDIALGSQSARFSANTHSPRDCFFHEGGTVDSTSNPGSRGSSVFVDFPPPVVGDDILGILGGVGEIIRRSPQRL